MTTLFEIFVPGTPQPAGSKKAVPVWNRKTNTYAKAANGRPIVAVMDDAKHSRSWKSHVSSMVARAWNQAPLDEPLELTVVFVMPRPGSHYGSRKGERYLKESAPHFHTSKPDGSKCFRALEDALTGVLYVDDARIAKQRVAKVYGDRPGAAIRLERAVPPE